jgi:hypothetical protein
MLRISTSETAAPRACGSRPSKGFLFFAFSRPSILDSGLGRIGIESNMFLERFFQPHKNSLPTKSLFQGLQSDFNVMVCLMLDHAIAHPVLSVLPMFSLWHDNGGMGYL